MIIQSLLICVSFVNQHSGVDATETVVTLTDMHLDHTGRILVAVASVYRALLGNKQTNKQTNKKRK